jgi:hypothetical protein
MPKIKHLIYIPFTGLGLYNGFRGNRWLKNRIKIFQQFVIPSLKAQTNQNFSLWISWRREEKNNPIVKSFILWLEEHYQTVHTFAGVCFYDDKYEDKVAKERLVTSVHGSMGSLLDVIGECDYVLMTLQPSDDCYHRTAFDGIQKSFVNDLECVGFKKGYICNYLTKELAEYNPNTNPPFVTIKFPREVFIDPLKHVNFTALKMDVGKYKAKTPCPSHEYYPFCLKYGAIDFRGFLVGVHSENISTTFVHPFKGDSVEKEVLKDFGIYDTPNLKINFSIRKRILRALPHSVQKKIRYLFGEKLWNLWYNFLRA